MAPTLEFYSPGKAEFSHGLEKLRFFPSTKDWFEANLGFMTPRRITADFLSETEAPWEVVAVLRSVARFPLLEGMKMGKQTSYTGKNAEVWMALEHLRDTNAAYEPQGDITKEATDADRTENVVIPFGKGLSIVVNEAWGVGWRVEKRIMLAEHPQLGKVQNPDERVITGNEDIGNKFYIVPDELAEITRRQGLDVEALVLAIADFRDKMIWNGFEASVGTLSGGSQNYDDYRYHYLRLEVGNNGSRISNKSGLELLLGMEWGIKRVKFFSHGEDVDLPRIPRDILTMMERFYDVHYK